MKGVGANAVLRKLFVVVIAACCDVVSQNFAGFKISQATATGNLAFPFVASLAEDRSLQLWRFAAETS